MTDQINLFESDMAETIFEGEKSLSHLRENFHPAMQFSLMPTPQFVRSVSELGVIQPITIWSMSGQYVILSGKRRFLAAEQVGLESIPCVIKEMPAGLAYRTSLDANIHRSRNPVDELDALKSLSEWMNDEGHVLTDRQTAQMLGITVAQLRKMRRIDVLPEAVHEAINERRITVNNAEQLTKLPDESAKPLIDQLSGGERVTAADIKHQKRVVREQEQARVMPLIDFPDIRPDLPSKRTIMDALESQFDFENDVIRSESLAEFILGILENPDQFLAELLEAS